MKARKGAHFHRRRGEEVPELSRQFAWNGKRGFSRFPVFVSKLITGMSFTS